MQLNAAVLELMLSLFDILPHMLLEQALPQDLSDSQG